MYESTLKDAFLSFSSVERVFASLSNLSSIVTTRPENCYLIRNMQTVPVIDKMHSCRTKRAIAATTNHHYLCRFFLSLPANGSCCGVF